MKKTIIVLALALGVIYAALELVSSLGGDGEYAAERLLYRALKNRAKILVNPDVAPPAMITGVERDLNKILTKYPKTKMARTADLIVAEFYIDIKKYNKALSTLNAVMEKYKSDTVISSRAQFLKGSAYERQGRWDVALREYTLLRDRYTNTPLGLSIPIYIGRYYLKQGREAEADEAYRRAVLFYRKLEIKNRGKALGYAASTLLIRTHMQLKQYEEAGKAVEECINNYPIQLTLRRQLSTAELIFVRLLKRPEKAIEIFNNVKAKVKDARLRKFLEERIDKFKKV